MKKSFRKRFSTVCSVGLAAFGYGCEPVDEPVVLYGVPHAQFKFNVYASDALSGNHIKGLRVAVTSAREDDPREFQSDTTNSDGFVQLEFADFPVDSLKLTIEDIDGVDNGSYSHHQEVVKIANEDYVGGDDPFDQGTVTKTINAKMDPKP